MLEILVSIFIMTLGLLGMAALQVRAAMLARGRSYFAAQAVTGFGMYAAMSDARLPRLFAWIVPLMGGDFAVRQWHHMAMWFFVVFTIVHVYLVAYHDYVEGRGVTSSMVGGWKFIEKTK